MLGTWYFISSFAKEAENLILGSRVVSIQSTSSQEIVFTFSSQYQLNLTLGLNQSLFWLEEAQNLNGQKQFQPIWGKEILSFQSVRHERSLFFEFDDGLQLIIELRGNKARILLVQNGFLLEHFPYKKSLQLPSPLPSPILEIQDFSDNPEDYDYPPFKFPWLKQKELLASFNSQYFNGLSLIERKQFTLSFDQDLQNAAWAIQEDPFQIAARIHASEEGYSALTIAESYCKKWLKSYFFENARQQQLSIVREKIKRKLAQIQQSQEAIQSDSSAKFQQNADLLMANLHAIKIIPQQEFVEVPDFTFEKTIRIKVNSRLSVGANASHFYRKARHARIIQQEMEQSLIEASEELEDLKELENKILSTVSIKEIRALRSPETRKNGEPKREQFRTFEIDGYRVIVGKSADSNDEVLKQAGKNDLWFHARNVPGSHVVLFCKNKVPDTKTLEKTASLAAFFSRMRSESLAAVQYTERKYVRKQKAVAGKVILEREKVIMVEPGLFF